MPHNPTTRLQKRLEIIERHKAMLSALKAFVKKHPRLINEYSVKELNGAKLGFKFGSYALIVPAMENGKVMLQLWRSGEDWDFVNDAQKNKKGLAENDVSGLTATQMEKLLHDICKEANPDEEVEGEQE